MGNHFCAGRDNLYKYKVNDILDEKGMNRASNKELENNFFGINDDSFEEMARLTRAYNNNDIKEYVLLCRSTTKIEKMKYMHPWAADPQTIGGLAATQLAILSAKEDNLEETAKIKHEIRRAGGIKVLVDLLRANEEDRLHAAVVALSFLSVQNYENCKDMYYYGALEFLVNGMKSKINGMRAACAQTARNIYIHDVEYRKEFVKVGGLNQFVRLLELSPGMDEDTSDLTDDSPILTLLEITYHIEDLIYHDSEELPNLILLVRNSGAVSKLRMLAKCNNKFLAEAAGALIIQLSD